MVNEEIINKRKNETIRECHLRINDFKKLLNHLQKDLDGPCDFRQKNACLIMSTIQSFMTSVDGFEMWQALILNSISNEFIKQNPLSAHEGTTTLH